jgi:hypothetical protein
VDRTTRARAWARITELGCGDGCRARLVVRVEVGVMGSFLLLLLLLLLLMLLLLLLRAPPSFPSSTTVCGHR